MKRITMLTRLLDISNSRRGMLPPTAGKPCLDFVARESKIPSDIPENQGVSSRDIADFLLELNADETLNMHNVVIARNGKILCEAYFGAHKGGIWKATFSACKSVTAIAIGMLIDEGKLNYDTKLEDIFAKEMNSVAKLRMRNMTVYDLLTMRSGMITFEETGAMNEEEMFKTFVSTPLSHSPGDKFYYNSTNTYVLSCIVRKVSGMGLSDYLEPRLFAPLEIKNYYWEKSAEGIEFGGWGLYISPCDFAKIGLMLLNGGEWNGKRIVSAEFVNNATKKHADSKDSAYGFNYGLQMWVSSDGDQFLFNGMLGQNVWCFKKSGIVIVNNAGNDELFQQSNYFAIVKKYFERDFDSSIPKNLKDKMCLERTLKNIAVSRNFATLSALEMKKYKLGILPAECASLDGKTLVCKDSRAATVGLLPLVWQVVENNYSQGFKSLSFEISDGKFYVIYAQNDEKYRFELGFGEPKYDNIYIHNTPFYIGATGCFAENDDGKLVLKIRIDFLETPCSLILKLIYHNGYFEVHQKEIPGKPFVLEKILSIKHGIAQAPVIGGVTNLAPDDVIEYQVERMFEFKFKLEEKTDK
ncbi:MAG: serine hydrolase domain-containing protein [Eubacteriales bacterium]